MHCRFIPATEAPSPSTLTAIKFTYRFSIGLSPPKSRPMDYLLAQDTDKALPFFYCFINESSKPEAKNQPNHRKYKHVACSAPCSAWDTQLGHRAGWTGALLTDALVNVTTMFTQELVPRISPACPRRSRRFCACHHRRRH